MDNKKEIKTEQTMVRFTPTERKALEQKAAEQGRSMSNLIHTVMMNYLNNN